MIDGEVVVIMGEGITLDRYIARRYRQYMPGYLERVCDLNQGLAGLGPVLPVGTRFILPPPIASEARPSIRIIQLWD